MPAPTLLFVYAVDGGPLHAIRDYVHKIVSPSTYPCKLCALTYGPLGELGSWSCAVEALPIETQVLHRDELLRAHPGASVALPAVLVRRGRELETLITAAEIDRCGDVDALVELVRGRVATTRDRSIDGSA